MGSYSIDNATATQGRYADVVATTQNSQTKAKISAANFGKKENVVYDPQNVISEDVLNEDAGEKTVNASKDSAQKEEVINDEEKMNSITETLNEFVAQFSAHLRFALHKDTEMLTVKFVDIKNNKVLKEFPPEEYLDMIAKIRKFIGAMVDEKV